MELRADGKHFFDFPYSLFLPQPSIYQIQPRGIFSMQMPNEDGAQHEGDGQVVEQSAGAGRYDETKFREITESIKPSLFVRWQETVQHCTTSGFQCWPMVNSAMALRNLSGQPVCVGSSSFRCSRLTRILKPSASTF